MLHLLHGDHLLSTALTTNSSGSVYASQGYYAYGRYRTGGTLPTDHKFTGQKLDGTGLYYYGARYYNPDAGQFLSPDTLVPDPTKLLAYNRYMYVLGNPMRLRDNSGHVWETVADVLSVGYDVYDIYNNGLSWSSGGALAADVVGAAVPFIPAPSACLRWCDDALQYGDDALGYVGNKVDDAWQWGKEAIGLGDEAADGATDVSKLVGDIPCANSFSGETLVATKEGLKPISTLAEGDIVLAYNEATGKVDYYAITDTIVHEDPQVALLTIDGETLTTTLDHPFYELESAPWLAVGTYHSRWTEVGDLHIGDRIQQADGSTGVVQAVTVVQQPQWMYNLTVAEAHTFFVGQQQWLVHNCENLVKIVEQDGDIVEMLAKGANGDITIITQMTKEGDRLVLNGLHIDGPGAGKSGISELRSFARDLGKQQGVTEVVIYGGTRTTGANPGRVPRPIIVKVD